LPRVRVNYKRRVAPGREGVNSCVEGQSLIGNGLKGICGTPTTTTNQWIKKGRGDLGKNLFGTNGRS